MTSVATVTHAKSPELQQRGGPIAAEGIGVDVELGSMYAVVDQIGARDLWEQGITGDGVNVALIDTGFSPVDDLSGSDKIVAMVDLSGEAGLAEARFVDTYGHGTHMAGIIAGRTPGADPAQAAAHPEWFMGVAPDAGLVSIKVADNTGATDITQVIAGVDWAVDHADILDIGVINLSYSSGSTLPADTDPLVASLERAWRAGIVVVVAAGNEGNGADELTSPAIGPFVIAVAGAEATADGSFVVPEWSSTGDKMRNPDLAAPGAHIESLRAPFSRIDLEHPEGYVSEQIFRGSGTSQAAAVVSGAVALLLDARPDLTPDQVKRMLTSDTTKVTPQKKEFSGHGMIKLDRLLDKKTKRAVQKHDWSTGDGSLDEARGGLYIEIDGTIVSGEVTVLGNEWEGTRWAGTRWADAEWTGTRWASGEWMGTRWADATWTGEAWLGTRWAGTRWADDSWSGTRWAGTRWAGDSWSGTRWAGTRWADQVWTGTRWAGTRWAFQTWAGTRWAGTRWAMASWG